jgi:bifunctional UDP-N-acetylglucosamine pyrophosphorylase/glucosamine-1-phosphate N-acetyltransferase
MKTAASSQAVHITGIILAAGKGTRMHSELPKVLHQVAGRSMLAHVCTALQEIPLQSTCLVLNEQLAPFHQFIADHPQINICLQHRLNGTASAVASCAALFRNVAPCSYAPSSLARGTAFAPTHALICAGDCPAIESSMLRSFIAESVAQNAKIALLAMEVENSSGYGRLVFSPAGSFERIVEERDADAREKKITLCNSGIVFAEIEFLFALLQQLHPHNQQQEYYLTDCFGLARELGVSPHVFICKDYRSCLGVNTLEQLTAMEAYLQQQLPPQ